MATSRLRMTKLEDTFLIVYAIRNDKGEWLRSKGFSGHGKHWVPALESARLYAKIGPARARVTTWKNLYPNLPTLKIYAFSMLLKDAVVMDETERVDKARLREATRQAEERKLYAERQLAIAEAEAARANRRVADLKRKTK